MPRLARFRTSIESAFTIRPRGRERLPCQAGVLFVNLVNNSSEGNKRSHADLMHNNRSAWRRFGKPPPLAVGRFANRGSCLSKLEEQRSVEPLCPLHASRNQWDGLAFARERLQNGLRSDWQMTDARARGSEDGISNRGRNRRGRRFTKPNWCFRTWQELHLDVRYISHA